MHLGTLAKKRYESKNEANGTTNYNSVKEWSKELRSPFRQC